ARARSRLLLRARARHARLGAADVPADRPSGHPMGRQGGGGAVTRPAIAAQLWTLHDLAARDLEGVLTTIAGLGYTAVEPLGLHGRRPADVRTLLDDLGMTVCSAHAPFPAGPDARKILDEQAELGADTVIW